VEEIILRPNGRIHVGQLDTARQGWRRLSARDGDEYEQGYS
jgi:hypothetical protein